MQRLPVITGLALAFAVASLAAGPLAAQPAQPAQPAQLAQPPAAEAAGPVVEKNPAARGAEPRRRGRAGGSRVWWNTPRVVEQLSLADEQRAQMDGYLDEYRESSSEEDPRSPFNEALRTGDWDKARSELKQLSEEAAASTHSRLELKIKVLSVLSDAQRENLTDLYPGLIAQPWVNAMRLPGRSGR